MSEDAETGGECTVSTVPVDDEATRDELEEIAAAAFPTPQDRLVHLSEHVLTARVGDDVAGGAVLTLVDGRDGPVGIVSWLFADPAYQGQGVGSQLLDEAREYLRERDCRAAVAVVEWTNTASSSLFARRGFERLSSVGLARRFGPRQGGLVYAKSFHFANVGCDLWCGSLSPPPESSDADHDRSDRREEPRPSGPERSHWRSAGRFGETVLVHAALLAIVAGGVAIGSWDRTTLLLAGVGGLLIALRVGTMLAATRLDPRRWTVSSWGNAYPLAGAVAVVGGFLPVPGHVAPVEGEWDYRETLPVLGPAATVWGLVPIAGLAALAVVGGQLDDGVRRSMQATLTVFVVVDCWIVVWPFEGYTGRVVFDWNRLVWAALATAGAVAVGVTYLG